MRNAKGGKNMANPTYDVHANDAASEASVAQFNIDRTHPGRWTISFNNPPINMFVPSTIVELGALMTDLEADPSVKVIVFQSARGASETISCCPATCASPAGKTPYSATPEVGVGLVPGGGALEWLPR